MATTPHKPDDDYPQITEAVFGPPDDKSEEAIAKIIDHVLEDKGVFTAIGTASYHQDVRIKEVLATEYESIRLSDFDCNWLLPLFVTTDESHVKEASEIAIRYIKEKGDRTPGTHGQIERADSEKKYMLYAIVHRHVTYEVHYSQNQTPAGLEGTIDTFLQRYNNPPFYIGITSGTDPISAMIRRRTGDHYKDLHGINLMIAIYESQDQNDCRYMEQELVNKYENYPNKLNRRRGGGGRPTSQPWSYVYLGLSI